LASQSVALAEIPGDQDRSLKTVIRVIFSIARRRGGDIRSAVFITESPSGPRWIIEPSQPTLADRYQRTKVHRRIYGTNRDEAISRFRAADGGGEATAERRRW